MLLSELLHQLHAHPMSSLQMMLPDGTIVPKHFHVTEVGRVQKDFIDCGGTLRSTTTCVLQVWVSHDTEHRLDTTRLAKIISLADPVLRSTDLPVEFEYESGVLSQYPLVAIEAVKSGLHLQLGAKHTACLAEDRCRVPSLPVSTSNCSAPGCC